MRNDGWKHWSEQVTDPLESIPAIGTFLAGAVIMVAAMAYCLVFITFLCFILIPFQCMRGIVNPRIPAREFLFGDGPFQRSPNRLDFIVVLSVYILFYGGITYFLLR